MDSPGDLFAGVNNEPTPSTGARIAATLRAWIIEGRLAPGAQLSEKAFAQGLNISRNTLREAMRLLAHEGLLVHELNRGVFVRELTSADVLSIYQLREFLEVSAVRNVATHTESGLARVRSAVAQAIHGAQLNDWTIVATANMSFHASIAGLAQNPRIDAAAQQLLAELRLAFHVMQPAHEFHEPYVRANEEICNLLHSANVELAAASLSEYLARARDQLFEAFVMRETGQTTGALA